MAKCTHHHHPDHNYDGHNDHSHHNHDDDQPQMADPDVPRSCLCCSLSDLAAP